MEFRAAGVKQPHRIKPDLKKKRPDLTTPSSLQGSLVAVGTHKGYVQIWDAAGGRKLTSLEGHSARVGQSVSQSEAARRSLFPVAPPGVEEWPHDRET